MQDSIECMLDYANEDDLSDSGESVSDVDSDDSVDIQLGQKEVCLDFISSDNKLSAV